VGRLAESRPAWTLEFDHYPSTVHRGDTISVATEGATAERLPTEVLLKGCSLPGA